jgi:divalent metal cation (Fe/Co/Zn/Cd) transporter
MSDLHEARGPEREPQIDTVGWLFLAFAVAITAAAAMVAYMSGSFAIFAASRRTSSC